MTKKENIIQFIKFGLFSISAGLIQVGSFTLLNVIIQLRYIYSYFIALTLSVLCNFTVNRKFTFKSANNIPIAMSKVFLFYLIFTPLSLWWGDALVELSVNEYLVLGGTMITNLVLEFFYSRQFVYKGQMNTIKKRKTME